LPIKLPSARRVLPRETLARSADAGGPGSGWRAIDRGTCRA
jgi:hypothetical protein